MDEVLKMEESSNHEFCLKWNNFPYNFMSQFETLKKDEDFVDVTLYCCEQYIKAHKVILSACSPYLKNIFKEHPCKHPIIILDNLSFNNLEAVIQFVYTGQVYIQETELSSFLKAAKVLQIKGLSESTSQNLIEEYAIPVNENDDQINGRKSEAHVETKRLRNKKVFRRVSKSGTKENNEFYKSKKKKEKDWCVSKNTFEDNFEDSNQQVNIGEQNFESEDKLSNTSGGDDEYCQEDLKRPHWLDPRSCPMCNRTYSNLSNLRQHMKLIHNPTFASCTLCNKTFKTELYLRRHISSYHELGGSGNVNGPPSKELFIKSIHSQPTDWNPIVKLEQHAFQEMFSPNEMYHNPQ